MTAGPEQHRLMWRFLRYTPRQLRYLGGSQEWFGAGPGRSIGGAGGGLVHIVVHAPDFIDVDHLKEIRSKFQLLNVTAL